MFDIKPLKIKLCIFSFKLKVVKKQHVFPVWGGGGGERLWDLSFFSLKENIIYKMKFIFPTFVLN